MAKAVLESTVRTQHDPTALGRMFKQRLVANDLLLGGIVSEYLRPSLGKLYRNAGFDFIFLENEHAQFMGSALADFVLSTRDNSMPVIVKCGDLNRAEIARLLEAGVVGIQLPRTESRAHLLQLAELMKFPPVGTRAGAPGFGSTDYHWPVDAREWLRKADDSTIIVAHIETKRGFENAEEIITAPHVDMVYVGPYDFSISMGCPGDYDDPRVKEPMREILKLCRTHHVAFGTTASGIESAKDWIERGCQFFEIVDEVTLISEGAKQVVDAYTNIKPR